MTRRLFLRKLITSYLKLEFHCSDGLLGQVMRNKGFAGWDGGRINEAQMLDFLNARDLLKGVKLPTPKVKTKKKNGKKSKRAIGKDFYRSPKWLKIRYQVLKRDGRVCACCGALPGKNMQMHVDHIKPRSLYPLLELDIDNLQVLCEDCNMGKSNTDETDWRTHPKLVEDISKYH